MTTQADRLRRARIDAGFERTADAQNEFGWNRNSYKSHENGNAAFSYDQAKIYARAFGVNAMWLFDDDYRGPMKGAPADAGPKKMEFPVVGRVAAGIEGHYDNDYAPGDGYSDIVFDPEEISLVLKIEGASMQPRYRDGETILCGYQYRDPMDLVRQDVFVQLKDGRKLFKNLRKGSRPGLWDLYSINPDYDPIRDVEVEWASPVKWHAI